jgi:hypothetical protein
MPTTLWRFMGRGIGADIERIMDSRLFDIAGDYAQSRPINHKKLEGMMIDKLVRTMRGANSLSEQFERLGLRVK